MMLSGRLLRLLPSQRVASNLLQPAQRSFVKSMDDRKEEQERKAFVDDINYFLAKEQFNLFDFHERVLVSLIVLN